LYSGWLIARKGPHVLLDALSKIKHQPWKAIIVGRDMGLKNDLIAGVELLKLHERVIIMEGIPYEDLMVLYSQAQIFVFPTLSQDEGFGLVALEAMAHGVPVIGSRTGAIPEVVKDQETGFLFNPGDSDELAACLLKLLHQTDRRAEMGKAARIRASQFSWEKNASQLIQTYEEVIFHAKPI
jgi:glycosyltransferase involved in cell wall biosynthesis